VYSFGVLLLEAITGRDPVDYSRSAAEVCPLVNHEHSWLCILYVDI